MSIYPFQLLLLKPRHERRAHAKTVRPVHHDDQRGIRVLRYDRDRSRERLDVVRRRSNGDDDDVRTGNEVAQIVRQHARRIDDGDASLY